MTVQEIQNYIAGLFKQRGMTHEEAIQSILDKGDSRNRASIGKD